MRERGIKSQDRTKSLNSRCVLLATLGEPSSERSWAQAVIISDEPAREQVLVSVLHEFSIRPVTVESPVEIRPLL